MSKYFTGLYHKYMYTSRRVIHNTHATLEKVGLYRGQPPLLFALWENDEQSRRELCDSLNRQPATITKMVTRLTKSGFVYSKADSNDSRVSLVCLTDHGKNIKEEVTQLYEDLHEEVFDGFTDKELKEFESYLDRMVSNIRKKGCQHEKNA